MYKDLTDKELILNDIRETQVQIYAYQGLIDDLLSKIEKAEEEKNKLIRVYNKLFEEES